MTDSRTDRHPIDLFGDYKANADNGHSTLASVSGAVAGLATRGATQLATFNAVGQTMRLATTGSAPAALSAATGNSYMFSQIDQTGRAVSKAVANAVDDIQEKLADSDIHYSIGADEPGPVFTAHLSRRNHSPRIEENKSQYPKANRFGMENPPTFSLLFQGDHGSRNIKNLSVTDIRKLKGDHVLIYAITDKGLIISSQGTPTQRNQHLHLTAKEPVYCAGNLSVSEGQIVEINNSSGGYRPQGAHLNNLVTTVFTQNGFTEAPGRFKNFYENEQKNQETILVPSNIASNHSTAKTTSALNTRSNRGEVAKNEVDLSEQDKQTAEFLVAYGSSPAEVMKIYQDTSAWELAKNSVVQFRERELRLEQQKNHENCIEFFNGAGAIFDALSKCKSPELAHIGKFGAPIMMGLANVEKLWGVFSGTAGSLETVGFFGSFGAVAGLAVAGIGLLNALLSSDDESQQRQLMESLDAIQQYIATFRREVHERFDHVDAALHGIAHMVANYSQQILRNQQILFEQNRQHIELSLQGFRVVTSMLNDLRVGNRFLHERLYSRLSYLVGLTEDERFLRLKESIENKVEQIDLRSKMVVGAHKRAMTTQLIGLAVYLNKRLISPNYNGKKTFEDLKSNPLESSQFLARRGKNKDDALGFLAEEMERVTQIPLKSRGIKKELLPVTGLWFKTVADYVRLARLPIFSDVDSSAVVKDITEQSDNLRKFTQEIGKSVLIPILLARHQQYINEFQEQLFKLFINRRHALGKFKEQKSIESRDKILKVSEYYFSEERDRAVLEKILNQLDYNYLLLNRFAYLGGLSPEVQLKISELDRSTTLLEQSFNFNESPGYVPASGLMDASSVLTYNYDTHIQTYHYSYQYEHLEMVGSHLYGPPGSERMVFVSTQAYSEDWPTAANSCSLNMSQYDVTSKRTLEGSRTMSYTGPKPPFPLIQYKGNYNTSVKHVWASSQMVSMSGKPFFAMFTGGSGYIALYDITEKQWLPCDNNNSPAKFNVPLPWAGTPNSTCYTHVIRDRYMVVSKVVWPNKADSSPEIYFYGFDLQNKWWLFPYEVTNLFTHTSNVPSIELPKLNGKTVSPNQFFINKIKPVGNNEAIVYGIVQPVGEKLGVSFHYKPIDPTGEFKPGVVKTDAVHCSRFYPIDAKTIHQVRSEVLKVNGENILIIAASITKMDGKNKLVFLSADFYKDKYEPEPVEFDLPNVHPNSDWQAMRTAVAIIGGKPQLIVTLLNSEFRMMIFCYDPSTKTKIELGEGPQLNFVKFEERRDIQRSPNCDFDRHLESARRAHPGHYPVRPIEIRVAQSGDMTSLLVSYPVSYPGALSYELRVTEIPLSPVLKVKPTSEVSSLLTGAVSNSNFPKNHLGVELCRTHLALSAPKLVSGPATKDDKVEMTDQQIKENLLIPALTTCKKIQKLFSAVIPELKLSASIEELVGDEIKTMNSIIAKLGEMNASSMDEMKKGVAQLEELFKVINTIDGYFKLDKNYSSGIGVNINRQIDQLKEELVEIKKNITGTNAVKLAATGFSLFSLDKGFTQGALNKLSQFLMNLSVKQTIPGDNSKLQQLNTLLGSQGLKVHEIARDGNCFYRAVAHQLNSIRGCDTFTHEGLREMAVNHVITNIDFYKQFITGDVSSFILNSSEHGKWAEDIMPQALARALNINLIVINSNGSNPVVIKRGNELDHVTLGYEVGAHYGSVVCTGDRQKPWPYLHGLVENAKLDDFIPVSQASHKLAS